MPEQSHALDYAAKGWAVIPLRGKVPLTTHGVTDATTNLDVIRSWWTRWPDANIGARVPDRLVVLDLDPRNGGTVEALFPGSRPPATLTCVSGRQDGGMHLYFLRPTSELTSTRLPRGIDLKVNGYLVMPPSIHPVTGQTYTWCNHTSVTPLPPSLLETLRAKPTVPRPMVRRGNSQGLVAFVARQTEGNRDEALYWAACRAEEDGTLEDIAEDLVTAAVVTGLSEQQARAKLHSARRTVGAVR